MDKKIKDLIAQGKSHRQIAEELNISTSTVSRARNRNHERSVDELITRKEEDGIHEIKYEGGEVKTREEFYSVINFDPTKSEVISYQCNLRPVVIRVNRTETKLINKYEHFLRTKPIQSIDIDSILARVSKTFKEVNRKPKQIPKRKDGKAIQINIFDAHINKKSFSGGEWNTSIAYNVYLKMIQDMVDEAPSGIDKVLLCIGQDFFNSDANARTTSGTPQDNVENEEEAFEVGLKIIMDSIDLIYDQLKCKIDVISMPGNHARMLEQVMGTALSAVYRNHKHISIDYKPAYRKYWTYGVSAVCLTHGDGMKIAEMPMIFANERPDLWGNFRYKELHHGHIHTQMVSERNGLIIRSFASTTTTDAWHDRNGYIGNIRGGHMIVWDKELGNKAQFNYYI